ncbi:nucleoside phosphatase family-domain-containing protein [Phakopsora pachyrhizi]|nr:nucleoside phosphatase family-domain-containing protein [Phakopsora pachyrhizi]
MSVRTIVISGEAEGGFGCIAVNYLIVGFDKHGKDCKLASTYGFLDMGGASTQIAFEPSAVERIFHAENLTKLGLKLLDKTDEKKKPLELDHDPEEVPDPSLPTNLTLASSSPSSSKFQLRATGDFAFCMKNLSPSLYRDDLP